MSLGRTVAGRPRENLFYLRVTTTIRSTGNRIEYKPAFLAVSAVLRAVSNQRICMNFYLEQNVWTVPIDAGRSL
jgi:hypothetical protein